MGLAGSSVGWGLGGSDFRCFSWYGHPGCFFVVVVFSFLHEWGHILSVILRSRGAVNRPITLKCVCFCLAPRCFPLVHVFVNGAK